MSDYRKLQHFFDLVFDEKMHRLRGLRKTDESMDVTLVIQTETMIWRTFHEGVTRATAENEKNKIPYQAFLTQLQLLLKTTSQQAEKNLAVATKDEDVGTMIKENKMLEAITAYQKIVDTQCQKEA